MKKAIRKIIECIIVTILFGGISFVMVTMILNRESDAKDRQSTEESLAEAYIESVLNASAETKETDETETEPETTVAPTEPIELPDGADPYDYEDDTYHVRDGQLWTPDYAWGKLTAVLEIPKIELRRGIYTGTFEQIMHDLDIWMTVTARPDYVLGKTQYTIYGHNYPVEDLSFNRLKELFPGDYFTITNDDGVYFYEVTDRYAEWREIVTSDIVDNLTLPKENCYLLTCGRDEMRYKDLVVVGTMKAVYSHEEWKAHSVEILAEYEAELKQILEDWEKAQEQEIREKKRFTVTVNTDDPKDIKIDTDADEALIGEMVFSLLDADGLTVTDESGGSFSWVYDGQTIHIKNLAPGEYVFGVTHMSADASENYLAPEDTVLTLTETKIEKKPVSERDVIEYVEEDMPIRYWLYICGGVPILAWLICILLILIPKKKKKKKQKAEAAEETERVQL